MENQENISHLIKILRRMNSSEIGWILRDMSEDFLFDTKILNYLCKELFSPPLLISELCEGDMEVFLKSLPSSIVKFLYNKYFEFRKPILIIYDSKKLKSISDKNISEEESIQIIIQEILRLYESREISYNGMILNFNFPVCVKKNINKDDLYFLVLEDVLQCNKIVRIIIISRKMAGQKIKIQFENKEKEILNQKIYLDVSKLNFFSFNQKNIIHAFSFSKILAPGLRTAFIFLPKELSSKFTNIKSNLSLNNSGITQKIVKQWLIENNYSLTNHLAKFKNRLNENRKITRKFNLNYEGGFFSTIQINHKADFDFCNSLLMKEQIATIPFSLFTENKKFENHLRICISNIDFNDLSLVLKIIKNFTP